MAAFDDSAWLGPRQVRPTEAQLLTISQYAPAVMGNVDMSFFWRHAGYFVQIWTAPTQPNNNTVNGIQQTALFPFKVAAIEAGAETLITNVSAGLEVDPAGGTSYATILETAPLSTVAATMNKGAVLDGSEDILEGYTWRINFIGAGVGATTGHTVVLHCFRL